MQNPPSASLSSEQEAKLREAFKRCSPETQEAILHFRKSHDPSVVIVIVHGILQRYLSLEPGNDLAGRPDDMRLEELGMDSLTMLEVVMSIEEALDFRIEDSDARSMRTLGDVRRYVDDRVHGRTPSLPTIETYDRERIALLMPQQPPFLFLDKVELQQDTIRASYLFRGDEFFFQGHFKDDPVVPASIVFEAVGQACTLWILESAPARLQKPMVGNQVLFVGISESRFQKRAKPGDEIHMELKLNKLREPLAIFDGQAKVQNQLIGRIEGLTLAFGEFNAASFDATPAPATTAATP